MNTAQYEVFAARTAKELPTQIDNLLHAQIGLSGESGEFADAVKRPWVYGKELDTANCVEELGDAMWYIALAAKALGVTLEQIMEANIAKLELRYPEKYTDRDALARADKAA